MRAKQRNMLCAIFMTMNLLKDNLSKIYFKYLIASFGSALIISIYSTVDMIVVGQYEGPVGSAALGVVTPCFSAIISAGILIGLGASALMSVARGKGDYAYGNRIFTLAIIIAVILSAVLTSVLFIFQKDFLRLFGADEYVASYAIKYMRWIVVASPSFLIGQVLIAFIRNDNAPSVAMLAVVCGGIVNTVGDIVLVFVVNMGISGAGLATAVGQMVSFAISLCYFFTKRCKIKLAKPTDVFRESGRIFLSGLAPFIVDITYGITVILFNNQIMRYFGNVELAVYGVLANVVILFQALFYGVGQALQPISSVNYGAGELSRVRQILYKSLATAGIMSSVFFAVTFLLPTQITNLYMNATPEVLKVAPRIIQTYSFAFLAMGINIVSGYYFQSVTKTVRSVVISFLRGFIFCILFIFGLPNLFTPDAIWWSMPLSEMFTLAAVVIMLIIEISKTKKTPAITADVLPD